MTRTHEVAYMEKVIVVDESFILVSAIANEISSHSDMVGIACESCNSIPDDSRTHDGAQLAIVNPLQSSYSAADLLAYYVERRGVRDVIAYLPAGAQAAASDCLQAGYSGIVSRSSPLDDLVLAVQSVLGGGIYSDGGFRGLESIADRGKPSLPDPAAGLTLRERAVLEGVARGGSSKEIARHLKISPKTVDTHRYRAMNKLGLAGRSAVVAHAKAHNWG